MSGGMIATIIFISFPNPFYPIFLILPTVFSYNNEVAIHDLITFI